jgi:hypothetical protein
MQHVQLERETETPCKSTAFNMSNEGGDYHDEHNQLHRSIISRPADCRQEKANAPLRSKVYAYPGRRAGCPGTNRTTLASEKSFTDLLFVSNSLKKCLNSLPHSPFALCQSFSRLGLN